MNPLFVVGCEPSQGLAVRQRRVHHINVDNAVEHQHRHTVANAQYVNGYYPRHAYALFINGCEMPSGVVVLDENR